jgi:hypothetical protein
MLNKDEIDFTLKEMIDHAIFLIRDCQEPEQASELLECVLCALHGNNNVLVDYWQDMFDTLMSGVGVRVYLDDLDGESQEVIQNIFSKVAAK